MQPKSNRVESADALRGLAALSVCLFHFIAGANSPLQAIAARSVLAPYGWLGVQAFFVISGFVVPMAMYRSGYRLVHFGLFMLKRIVRLDPPYLLVVFVLFALDRASATPNGAPSQQLLGHVFYGFSHLFVNFDWLNPVFWTLEIEFQYYVLIAVSMPFLFSATSWRAGLGVLGLVAASFVHAGMLPWLSVFAFGVTLALHRCGRISTTQLMTLLLIVTSGALLTVGKACTITAALATAVLAWPGRPIAVLRWLGSISFSFYLVHVPIGDRIFDAFGSDLGPVARVAVVGLALGASLLAATVLWRVAERPAQRAASRIRYSRSEGPGLNATTATTPA